ncbi:MAG TPA: glycosyltransferase family 4 protein [Thermoanaerobaculia bacterium]|jgi:glycosyltransferase involved in cell wall biosynthesis|nr:glycosyltransferase family 4 protein [Thermoanaerobaculia bacterium]
MSESGRRLSILLLYDCIYPGSVGGVEHRNYELARALAARGHRVTLAGFADGKDTPAPGVETLPLGPRGRLYAASGKRSTGQALRFAAKVARLDLSPYDLVETANIPYIHLFPLALRCRLARKPLVVTWYEYWGPYWREYLGPIRWLPYAAIERLAVPLGKKAIADSRLAADRVQARRGGEVPVVPVGIPIAAIRAAAEEPAEPGAEPAPPLIYAGRLLREKRVDLLLEAVALLAEALPEHRGAWLAILGSGPERERLEDLARSLGLADSVVFLGHLPTNADVWRSLGRAKVAVQPSSREGFGLFPLEAMAAGLPVVYCESPESALPELVRHGLEGVCTPPVPQSLAAAIAWLLGDAAAHERLAQSARERSEAYGWEAIAGRLENLFLELA